MVFNAKKIDSSSDKIFLRIFVFLLGASLISVSAVVLHINEVPPLWGYVILVLIFLMGIISVYISIFSTDKLVYSYAKRTGHHEVLFIFIILAAAITAAVRYLKKTP